MHSSTLQGRTILVVEDEPLIAMDVALAFQNTGVAITTTNTLDHALILVEHDGLAAAILDHALGDGDSTELYGRLNQRGVPFLIYSGFDRIDGVGPDVPHLMKPAPPADLIAAVEQLIRRSGQPRGPLGATDKQSSRIVTSP